jgi:H+/gluconate symporter-like permease
MVALHTAIAIVLAIGLIIRFKVDPVISLILASLYLGLASGVGFAGTIEAITVGFGEIMAEVGLLIGFGVLIGAFLHAAGAFHRLVDVLVRGVGAARLPYALTAILSTILPSIYVDVQVVLASPVARSASPYIGRIGLPLMASALGAGIFAGYVFVIPGLAAISIAGLLDVSLGAWLLFGIVIGPLTAILTSLLMRLLLRGRYWKEESDEDVDEAMVEQEAHEMAVDEADEERSLPLVVLLLPILVPLLMIAFGAFAELLDFSNAFIAFLGNANLALFVGLLGAYLLSRAKAGLERTRETMDEGFHTTGEILLRGSSQHCCTWRSGRCRSPPSPRPASSHRSSAHSRWHRSSSGSPLRRARCSRSRSTATSSGCSRRCSACPPRAPSRR